MAVQYIKLVQDILAKGDKKAPAREYMPGTIELFAQTMKFDLQQGFPLLTTKKMSITHIAKELLWFLRGDSSIQYLVENGCNIWNPDTYSYYLRMHGMCSRELSYDEWLEKAATDPTMYDSGDEYPSLWRHWRGNEDQILNLLNIIKYTPESRYQVVSAWDPEIVSKRSSALPSCHMLWQTSIRADKYLDLAITQRSCDVALGVPYNIASYALLVHVLAHMTGYEPGELTWTGNSCHIYENHIDTIREQIDRLPYRTPQIQVELPEYDHGWTDIDDWFRSLTPDMFKIVEYEHHPVIKYELFVGLKK